MRRTRRFQSLHTIQPRSVYRHFDMERVSHERRTDRTSTLASREQAIASYWTQRSADYDLVILNPSGTKVAQSTSWDNTYEIVDFNPAVSGTYTIRVVRDRCDVSPRTLAYAWWRTP